MLRTYQVRQSLWEGERVDIVSVFEQDEQTGEHIKTAQYAFNAQRECVSPIGLNTSRFLAAKEYYCG